MKAKARRVLKAAETERPYSALVNEALRQSLAEDARTWLRSRRAQKSRACRSRNSSRISSGVGSYSVRLKRSAAREIEALPRKDRARIIERIRTLSEDPRPAGSTKLSDREAYRIRQGDYRIVYTVDDEDRVVLVSVVAHRRDA